MQTLREAVWNRGRGAASIRFIHPSLDKITDIKQLDVVDGKEKLFDLKIA